MQEWVILLEAAAPERAQPLELSALEALLGVLADHSPTAIYAPDRYALQFAVSALDPGDALDVATACWRSAAVRADVPRWRLVRAEVKTPDELAAECRAEDRTVGPPPPGIGQSLEAAYRATRALVTATTVDAVVAALTILVHDLGGVVMPASYRHTDAMPVDLSLGTGQPVVPVAERLSVARLQLEDVLPVVLEDARSVVNELRRRELTTPVAFA